MPGYLTAIVGPGAGAATHMPLARFWCDPRVLENCRTVASLSIGPLLDLTEDAVLLLRL